MLQKNNLIKKKLKNLKYYKIIEEIKARQSRALEEKMKTIIGIKLNNRTAASSEMQEILTNYGCIIRTRIGLHDVDCGKCSSSGIILLEVINDELLPKLQKELCSIDGIELQQMVFDRD